MLEDDLLEAIRAAPEDDAPRLVYADWLLERGDWRGELIHVQCQLAARTSAHARRRPRGRPSLRELEAAERALLARLDEARPDWAAEWPPPYRRGFATRVVVRDAATLLAQRPAIRRGHPVASEALTDGSTISVSADGSRYAVLTTKEEGAGVTLDNYSAWTTTTVKVFDRAQKVLHSEDAVFTRSCSCSGESEGGETIAAIALSPDGRTLTLTMSASGTVIRTL